MKNTDAAKWSLSTRTLHDSKPSMIKKAANRHRLFNIPAQSTQDKCFPNSSLFKHNKEKERKGNICHSGINVFPWTPQKNTTKVFWPKVRKEMVSSLWFKITENILVVSDKFILCYYRETTCAAEFWSEVCLVWAVTKLQYMKGYWTVSAHTSLLGQAATKQMKDCGEERVPDELLLVAMNNSESWLEGWVTLLGALSFLDFYDYIKQLFLLFCAYG